MVLAISLDYPSGEEGGNFLNQMISTCLRYAYRKGSGGGGGGGSAPPNITQIGLLRPVPSCGPGSGHIGQG
jgi:hypothetical protein